MTLAEKRQMYKCGEGYVTLNKIPAWPVLYKKVKPTPPPSAHPPPPGRGGNGAYDDSECEEDDGGKVNNENQQNEQEVFSYFLSSVFNFIVKKDRIVQKFPGKIFGPVGIQISDLNYPN